MADWSLRGALPLSETAGFDSVTAHGHVAPSARSVLAPIQEKPRTIVGPALAYAIQSVRREQFGGRLNHWPKNTIKGIFGIPFPPVYAVVMGEPPPHQGVGQVLVQHIKGCCRW